jgi:hypothetical protein
MLCGFAAGALSVLTFHQAMWAILHLLAIPGMTMPPPFPLRPVILLGWPGIANYAFWAGWWGAAFGLVLPKLPGRPWLGGLTLGLAGGVIGMMIFPLVKHYQPGVGFIPFKSYMTMLTVLSTYGLPIGAGPGAPLTWVRNLLINGSWGLGLGLILPRLLAALGRR